MASHISAPVPYTSRYACETRVVSGLGCIKQIGEELKTYKISRPVLIADAGLADAGLLEQWLQPEVAAISPRILSPVNPNLQQVQKGIDAARAAYDGKSCDGVIIVGGGSAICLGKAVAICLSNPGQILDYEGDEKLSKLPVPTICVPTTAGSGSEVSRALVLVSFYRSRAHDDARILISLRQKHEPGRPVEVIVRAYGSEPRVALLDGEVLISAPRKSFLDASLDAMTHACEALWSRRRSLITDALAEKALITFLDRLAPALNNRKPDDLQAIMEASSMANLACGNTGLALCHAMNTAPDVPLAHGYINGCILSAVAKHNRPLMDPQHQVLVDRLPALFQEIGWEGRFQDGEVNENYADLFVRASQGHPFRKNNIRETSDKECYELLRESGARVSIAA